MLDHYLMFNRNCEEALKTYEKAFNTTIAEIQKYKDMPPNPNFPIPESDMDLVLHARLAIDGQTLMCADSKERSKAGDNMYISYTIKDVSAAQNAWNILKNDGIVYMDLQPSFFADLHGSLQDKFGINWMFTVPK